MDREIKILHTADSHIGYRQYHSDVCHGYKARCWGENILQCFG
jgi:hypothetical protein